MRIYAIRNCEPNCSAPQKNRVIRYQTIDNEPKTDTVSFKSKALKGTGIGALFGLAAMGTISALSGGLAAPVAYAAYAGIFGTAGCKLGHALDQIDKEEKEGNN